VIYYSFYYLLIGACLALAVALVIRGSRRHFPLAILFTVTLLVELGAEILIALNIPFVWLYHIYSPVEYSLISLFIAGGIESLRIRRAIRVSIPVFVAASLSLSTIVYRYADMPSINIGIESLLVFSQATVRLFNLEVTEDEPIFHKESFWISTGLLLFFGVCTFILGVYSPLFKLNPNDALNLFGMIVKPFNLILYTFIMAGLLCSVPGKSSTRR